VVRIHSSRPNSSKTYRHCPPKTLLRVRKLDFADRCRRVLTDLVSDDVDDCLRPDQEV
jgi:hypothetical protein